jgi:regulator of replication initiation timing
MLYTSTFRGDVEKEASLTMQQT